MSTNPDDCPAEVAAAVRGSIVTRWLSRFSVFRRLIDRLYGYDYFISYHWKSGGRYAVGLAQQLRNRRYDCFLDQAEFAKGEDWRSTARYHLQNTNQLIVIATREALTESTGVRLEVREFERSGRYIIPVVFDSPETVRAIPGETSGTIRERIFVCEAQCDALERGPSEAAVDQILSLHRKLRKRSLRGLLWLSVASLILLLGASVAGFFAVGQTYAAFAARQLVARGDQFMAEGENGRAALAYARARERLPWIHREAEADRMVQSAQGALAEHHHLASYFSTSNIVRVVQADRNYRLLIAGDQGEIELVDLQTEQTVLTIPEKDPLATVSGAEFSPDNAWFVACAEPKRTGSVSRSTSTDSAAQTSSLDGIGQGVVRFYEAATGQELDPDHRIGFPLPKDVAVSRDGQFIAVCGRGSPSVSVFEAVGRRAIRENLCPSLRAYDVEFSPDGRYLAVAGRPGQVEISDWHDPNAVARSLKVRGTAFCVSFHPGGEFVAVGDARGAVSVWHWRTERNVTEIKLGKLPVRTVQFSDDGHWLLASGEDGAVRLFQVSEPSADGRIHLRMHGSPMEHAGQVHAACFLPHNTGIATGGYDAAVKIWQTATNADRPIVRSTQQAGLTRLAASRSGKRVVAATGEVEGRDSVAVIFDAQSWTPAGPPLKHDGEILAVALDDLDQFAATLTNSGRIHLWDAATGESLRDVRYSDSLVTACQFVDGQLLVTGGSSEIWVIDAHDPQRDRKYPIPEMSGKRAWVLDAHVAQNRLLLAGAGQFVSLLRLDNFQPLAQGVRHEPTDESDIRAGTLSDDGRFALTCGVPNTARVWDTTSGLPTASPPLEHAGGVVDGQFDHKTNRVVTGSLDRTMLVWDRATGRKLWANPALHGSYVTSVRFSPNDALLVSGCEDGRATLWHAASGIPTGQTLFHREAVSVALFLADDCVVTASDDGALTKWRLAPPARITSSELNLCTEALTGMRLSGDGVTQLLSRSEWLAVRESARRTKFYSALRGTESTLRQD